MRTKRKNRSLKKNIKNKYLIIDCRPVHKTKNLTTSESNLKFVS